MSKILNSCPLDVFDSDGRSLDLPSENNRKLQQLIGASGLSLAVSMTIFNRGLGAAACTERQWKGYLELCDSSKFLELSADQLAHAVKQFSLIGVKFSSDHEYNQVGDCRSADA